MITLVFRLLGTSLFRAHCTSLCGTAMLGAHLHLPLPCADDQPEALYCAAYAGLLLKQGIHSELNGRKALNLRYSVRLVLLTGFMTALLTMRKLRSPLSVAEAESCFIEFPQFFNPPSPAI